MASTAKRAWQLQDFMAHGANVNCLALGHKSGRVLVTGGDDKKVNLWAVGKHNCIMSLSGHITPVECVRFNPTEELVVAGSSAGALKIWDLEAAKLVRTLTGHKAGVRAVDFHPYGDFLTSGSLDATIRLWDIRRKGFIFTYKGHRQTVNSLKFSPDGQWIASGGEDGLIKLWDLRAGRVLHEFTDHSGPVTSVEFHPREFLLASASTDKTVYFWDLDNFAPVSTTEKENPAIRCVEFSQNGDCLYGGGQDMLRVYGWEPARMLDSVPVMWGKVQDIAATSTQLIGASFFLTNVSIWIVDLTRIAPLCGVPSPQTSPFSHGQTTRRSFSKKPSPDKPSINVKTIEEVDRLETDPEDETLADIPDVNDYKAIFQPNRSLNRSPPPAKIFPPPLSDEDTSVPSIIQTSAPPPSLIEMSDRPEHPFAMEPQPPSPPVRSNQTPRPGSPRRRVPSPSLAPPPRTSQREQLRRLSSCKDPELTSSDSEYIVKSNNIHHSPSEPALSNRSGIVRSRSSSLSRPYQAHHRLSNPVNASKADIMNSVNQSGPTVKIYVPPERDTPSLVRKEERDDDFVPISMDKPSGLDLEDFLPVSRSLYLQSAFPDMSESEVISSVTRGHDSMMAVLKTRERNLQIIYSLWHHKDLKTAVDSAVAMNDLSIIVDLLGVITNRPGIWNLDICVSLLPRIYDLLQSKYELYMKVGCDALRLILRTFTPVIKTNINSSSSVGVDISREERYNKCVKCYQSLLSIRAFLLKRQTMQGKLGHSFRELHILLEALDSH